MAKITEYPSVSSLLDNNVFIIDGPNGTQKISSENLKKYFGNLSSIAPTDAVVATAAHAVGSHLIVNGQLYEVTTAIAIGDTITDTGNNANVSSTNVIAITDALASAVAGKISSTEKGSSNGVASLDSTGKVPSSQLPSYVDDVIEGYLYNGGFYSDSQHTEAITGESGKIYVDLSTSKTYRWGGSVYAEIGSPDKADKVTGATSGNFAALDANGNLTDSGLSFWIEEETV